jgi:hypothetical protein
MTFEHISRLSAIMSFAKHPSKTSSSPAWHTSRSSFETVRENRMLPRAPLDIVDSLEGNRMHCARISHFISVISVQDKESYDYRWKKEFDQLTTLLSFKVVVVPSRTRH